MEYGRFFDLTKLLNYNPCADIFASEPETGNFWVKQQMMQLFHSSRAFRWIHLEIDHQLQTVVSSYLFVRTK